MKVKSYIKISLFLCLVPLVVWSQEYREECTIGVAAGNATTDGRPLLWKNRDTKALNNEVNYFVDGRFKYLTLVSAGHSNTAWAGVNEMGFCIMNSASNDLKDDDTNNGMGNGSMMKLALQTCVTVDDFEEMLVRTNVQGRNTSANFGVIDAFGGAAIFESGYHSFTKFDANDPEVAPKGFIVRSNFAKTGGGDGGLLRYKRGYYLWNRAVNENKLDYKHVLRKISRDLADENGNPYDIPFNGKIGHFPRGSINTYKTINRYSTASVALFHGVKSNENPSLTTFWVLLGEPIFSVAVPCWVHGEDVAPELDGASSSQLCTNVLELKKANYHVFGRKETLLKTRHLKDIWSITYSIEDQIFTETDRMLDQWRKHYPRSGEVLDVHKILAEKAMDAIDSVHNEIGIDTTAIRVGVFSDLGASSVCVLETIASLEMDPEMKVQTIDGADVSNDILFDLDVIVAPGGSGSREAVSLGDDGRQKVIDFVKKGGGFIGICAGGYLGSDNPAYDWCLHMADAQVLDRQHYARGGALVAAKLTKAGKELFPEHKDKDVFFCYYHNGPLLAPGDNQDLPDYEPLAIFKSDVHLRNDAPPGVMPGTTFLLRAEKGKGRVILCSGHPESTTGIRWIVPRMAHWVSRREFIEYPPQFVNINEFSGEILFDKERRQKESRLLRTLKTNDKAAKKSAMKELFEMDSREFQRWLPGLLRDNDQEIRKMAAEMILKWNCMAARKDLEIAIANETDEQVKEVLIHAFNQLSLN